MAEAQALDRIPLGLGEVREEGEAAQEELGAVAATRAIELIEEPDSAAEETILPVELVVRASSSV